MCIYAYIRIHIHPCTGGPIKTFYGGCIICSLTFDLNRHIWPVHSTQNTSSHIVSYSKTKLQSQFKKKKYIYWKNYNISLQYLLILDMAVLFELFYLNIQFKRNIFFSKYFANIACFACVTNIRFGIQSCETFDVSYFYLFVKKV